MNLDAPPEITSALIHSGPGAGSLLEAALAWRALATQLDHTAVDVAAVISGLPWYGPSATSMTVAVHTYVVWLQSAAAQAWRTSRAAQAAADAFHTVSTTVVSPREVIASRVLLARLVSRNLFGQNAPAIAQVESWYMAMWENNTVALGVYRNSSHSAAANAQPYPAPAAFNPLSDLISFLSGNGPLGSILGGIFATTPGNVLSQYALSVLSAGFPVDIVALFTSFFGPFLGAAQAAAAIEDTKGAQVPVAVPLSPAPPPPEEPPLRVSATAGSSGHIGRLTTPPSWTRPAPTRPAPLRPLPVEEQPPEGPELGWPVLPAVPVAGAAGRFSRKGTDPDSLDYGMPVRGTVIPPNL